MTNVRVVLLVLLALTLVYFLFVVPQIEGTGTVVPRGGIE